MDVIEPLSRGLLKLKENKQSRFYEDNHKKTRSKISGRQEKIKQFKVPNDSAFGDNPDSREEKL